MSLYKKVDVSIKQLLDGAREARGLTVVIDVFRAFSTACYLFYNGMDRIYPVGDIDKAYELKSVNPDFYLIGERKEEKPEGFDFGNSPSHILNMDFSGKSAIHTTSSGTQGIVGAARADEIITGSFVNAEAIVRYIKSKKPEHVSLVCMGYACTYPTDEDTFCAEYIMARLEGKDYNLENIKNELKVGDGARFFEEENQEWSPKSDFDLCLDYNRFNFVLKVERVDELIYLRKIEL